MLAISRHEAVLTEQILNPAVPILKDLFLGLRAETDKALEAASPPRYGKPYPYGYCREITCDVLIRLRARLQNPRHPGEHLIKAYNSQGGNGRRVWGALRGSFFQNALQMGGLYIDVSNDTVDIAKPKVEILPMDQSGFELIQDAAHFARIGERYWGQTFYANDALPSLAPLFPILGVDASGVAQLHSPGQHMVELFRGSDFVLAEQWLEEAPTAPAAAIEGLRAQASEALLALNPESGRQAALDACGLARTQGLAADQGWRTAQILELLRLSGVAIPVLARE